MNDLHNINIERAVLSSIFFNPAQFEEVASHLKASDFYLPAHRYMFEAMEACEREGLPIDDDFVQEKMGKKFDENAMLAILTTNPLPSVGAYANEIKKKSAMRATFEALQKAQEQVLEENDPFVAFEVLSQKIEKIRNGTGSKWEAKIKSFSDFQKKETEFFCRNFIPIPRGAISLLTAKGGGSKTMASLQLLIRFLHENPEKKAFGWFSEDSEGELEGRGAQICQMLNISPKVLKRLKAIENSEVVPHFTNFEKKASMTEEFYGIKHTLKPYDLIVLDPLIAFFSGNENDNAQARFFMNHLNSWVVKEHKAMVIIHHHSKDKENGGARGASAFVDAVRLQYTIAGDTEDNRHAIFEIVKDNWGVKSVMGGVKKKVQVWLKEIVTATKEVVKNVEVVVYDEAKPDFSSIPKLGGKK
ncbi:MAG: AAA family ATPase [Campylobacterales bacterium]|nr:AAA family ATPase [Campylobacterales bacterium]